ncbi:quinolinate synthase NadA [Collinsella sp. An2]|uniref:quinolinate synthase NadA n=1 Tax=Collinsella sp. An2 TaxID=1965585 RepID=UPI001EF6E47C|nr:quinolinate synthase NadA [Collinsella sp. An2]
MDRPEERGGAQGHPSQRGSAASPMIDSAPAGGTQGFTPKGGLQAFATRGTSELLRELDELKRQHDAVVLAHYYVGAEVQRAADFVGDSFALARLATTVPQRTLVIAGVSFMAESMKLLNPDKRVLAPDLSADCPMAHMVNPETVRRARERYGDDLAVVCYVNSTAEIKSWSDVCVTSSNAVKIVRNLSQHHVLFIPDEHLGRYVARQVPEKHVILNDGCCPFHAQITAQEVRALKQAHPDAPVLAHPECASEVLELADIVGSTAEIIDAAAASDAQEFIVVTMAGVQAELERRCGADRRFYFTGTSRCPEMDKLTLEKLVACLRDGTGEVPMPACAGQAAATLDRMLAYAAR